MIQDAVEPFTLTLKELRLRDGSFSVLERMSLLDYIPQVRAPPDGCVLQDYLPHCHPRVDRIRRRQEPHPKEVDLLQKRSNTGTILAR